ncbi:MAG: hypothetical protein AB7I79_14155 [Rhizobiaceae bacterium]
MNSGWSDGRGLSRPRGSFLMCFMAPALSLALIGLASPGTAIAQTVEDIYAEPGETILVASGDEEIKLTGGPGVVTTTAPGVAPQVWLLTYTPAKDGEDARVALSFTQDGRERTVLVHVSATPRSDFAAVGEAGGLLVGALLIAILLESAFSVIFNWRVFLEFFDGRGVRTVVMFAGALFVVVMFKQDFVASLFDAYLDVPVQADPRSTWGTTLLSALVLAGGSASVNALMVALGARQNRTADQVSEKPAPTKAWVAVKVRGRKKDDLVEVLSIVDAPTATDTEHLHGVIRPVGLIERLAKYFWRDQSRMPMTRGFAVDLDKAYSFVVRRTSKGAKESDYFDATGRHLGSAPAPGEPSDGAAPPADPAAVPPAKGTPRRYVFAPGAIVDFHVDLPERPA